MKILALILTPAPTERLLWQRLRLLLQLHEGSQEIYTDLMIFQ